MTYYAQVTNNEIQRINIQLPFSTPQASIGSVTFPGEHDLYPITGSEPTYDPATQRLSGPTYQFTGEAVERVYVVEDIPVEELQAKLMAEITESTQKRLDDFAKTRGYDNIISACSYATSSHPKYGPEGRYCVSARESTWDTLFAMLAEVQAGTRPVPGGYSEIEPELPVLEWP